MPERPEPGSDPRPRAPRHRTTVWTIVAPIGAIALFVVFFVALGNSCLADGCNGDKDAAAETDGPANDLPAGARAKVKPGDSVGRIAERFNLSEDEIKACNPTVDPQTLQPGQFLVVSAASCEGKDLAPEGANPDPLAGETSAAAKPPEPKENATAAADPSMTAAGDAVERDAEGDASDTDADGQ